jgi:hypothetical protein
MMVRSSQRKWEKSFCGNGPTSRLSAIRYSTQHAYGNSLVTRLWRHITAVTYRLIKPLVEVCVFFAVFPYMFKGRIWRQPELEWGTRYNESSSGILVLFGSKESRFENQARVRVGLGGMQIQVQVQSCWWQSKPHVFISHTTTSSCLYMSAPLSARVVKHRNKGKIISGLKWLGITPWGPPWERL